MYDQNILPITGPAVIAMLPSTGSDTVVELAIAVLVGMVIWGAVYSISARTNANA